MRLLSIKPPQKITQRGAVFCVMKKKFLDLEVRLIFLEDIKLIWGFILIYRNNF